MSTLHSLPIDGIERQKSKAGKISMMLLFMINPRVRYEVGWARTYCLTAAQGCRKWGGQGDFSPPPFLADPLTLSQPGGGTLSPPITTSSSRFSDLATALPPHHVIIIRTLLDKSSHHSTPQDITYFSPAESKSKSDVHRWRQKNKTENYEMGNFQFLSRPQRIMHKIFSLPLQTSDQQNKTLAFYQNSTFYSIS